MSIVQLLSLAGIMIYHGAMVSRFMALFALSITGHLLAGSQVFPPPVAHLIHIVALLPMPAFYLLCLAVFNDGFRPSWKSVGLILVAAPAAFLLVQIKPALMAAGNAGQLDSILLQFISSMPQSLLSGFVLAAFYTILRGLPSDLIPWRYRLRFWIFGGIGILSLGVAVTEIFFAGQKVPLSLEALKVALILLLTTGLMLWLLSPRADLFPSAGPRTLKDLPTTSNAEKDLLGALQKSILLDKVHHREGLTIGQLASFLGCQEYRLRRLINGELRYANFNQFLNAHRIQDAQEVLKDPNLRKKNILEVAFDLGYQSLAPFNLAFRKLTGETPTEYRNRHLRG